MGDRTADPNGPDGRGGRFANHRMSSLQIVREPLKNGEETLVAHSVYGLSLKVPENYYMQVIFGALMAVYDHLKFIRDQTANDRCELTMEGKVRLLLADKNLEAL